MYTLNLRQLYSFEMFVSFSLLHVCSWYSGLWWYSLSLTEPFVTRTDISLFWVFVCLLVGSFYVLICWFVILLVCLLFFVSLSFCLYVCFYFLFVCHFVCMYVFLCLFGLVIVSCTPTEVSGVNSLTCLRSLFGWLAGGQFAGLWVDSFIDWLIEVAIEWLGDSEWVSEWVSWSVIHRQLPWDQCFKPRRQTVTQSASQWVSRSVT